MWVKAIPSTLRFSEIVFAGNGIVDSTQDDYKGLDVRGKPVLMLAGQNTQSRAGVVLETSLQELTRHKKMELLLFW